MLQEATRDEAKAAVGPETAEVTASKAGEATEPEAAEAAGSNAEAATKPQTGDPAPRTPQKASSTTARLLDAGYIILSIPLFIIALDILIPRTTILLWPWWVTFAVNILGIAVTLGAVRQYAVPASILLWVMAWGAVYSLSVVGTSNSSYSTAVAVLSTECIIAAVVSFALCIWIVALLPKGIRNVNIFLAIAMGFFSVALVLAAIAFHTGKAQGGIWNAVGVTTIVAALGILLALTRTRSPVTIGS